MAQFSINAQRFDPYKNFKFRVVWDGRAVAGVSKVSALKRTTEVVEHREGGDPSTVRKSPGRTKYEPITLERGVTHDVEFERWANKVWNFGAGLGAEVSLKDFRKDIRIEFYNEAGDYVADRTLNDVDPKMTVLEGDIDINEDDGLAKGKKYTLKLTGTAKGKEVVFAQTAKPILMN